MWTKEDDELLITARNEKVPYKLIAKELGRTEGACQTRGYYYIERGLIKKDPPLDLTRDELLALVKKYRVKDACPNREWSLIRKEFGGWTKALEAANMLPNCGGLFDYSKPAILYLLKFDGFYKIGITQRPLEERTVRFPKHIVLDTYCSDLDEILSLEKEILSKVEPASPQDVGFIRNGSTECFLFRDITSLEDLL